MMANLLDNTTGLQEVLEILQTKATGGVTNYTLHGTYMLSKVPNYKGVDTEVAADLDGYEVYAYFHTPDSVFYTRIEKMSAGKASFYVKIKSVYRNVGW